MARPGGNHLSHSCDWRAKRDIDIYSAALDLYKLDNYQYPTTQQGLHALMQRPELAPIPDQWDGPYLAELNNDPWGTAYQYKAIAERFEIMSFGADGKAGGLGCDADIYSTVSL